MDIYQQWEALYAQADAAVSIPLIAVTGHEDELNSAPDLPFITYRSETERGIYGTPTSGSNKVLRSNFVFSVFAVDLADAMTEASALINALVDADFVTDDGYTTTALTLIGIIPLFESDGPNHAIHVRFMWERSI